MNMVLEGIAIALKEGCDGWPVFGETIDGKVVECIVCQRIQSSNQCV